MHEFGLCEDILGAVERRADGRRVTGVRVRVGAQHRVSEPALAQAFSMVAQGSVADGAALDVVPVPAHVRCRCCEAEADATNTFERCSACGATDLEVWGGDELLLESLVLSAIEPDAVTPAERSSDVSRHTG